MTQKAWIVGCLLIASGGEIDAQMLTIDMSNPSAAIFTGTGVNASGNFAGVVDSFPILLDSFFKSDQANITASAGSSPASTLETTGSSGALDTAVVRAAAGKQILILRRGTGSSETFSTGSAAFTGRATFDLSSVASNIQDAGWTGNIFADDGTTVVGTYLITTVPEPASYAAIFGLGCLSFGLWRKSAAAKQKSLSI